MASKFQDIFGQEYFSFLVHKISAAGAYIGLWDYDINSSLSVSGRNEIFIITLDQLFQNPWNFLLGHLRGQAYWPVDSQIFTYGGSFGVMAAIIFVAFNIYILFRAYSNRRLDGMFSFFALMMYFSIFFVNRILDYYPMASLYFLCIVVASKEYGSPTSQTKVA